LGKLANGVFVRIEHTDPTTIDIDTTDAASALRSLRRLAHQLGIIDKAITSPRRLHKQSAVELTDSELLPKPSVPVADHSTSSKRSVVACAVWTPPVTIAHPMAVHASAGKARKQRVGNTDTGTNHLLMNGSIKLPTQRTAPVITLTKHEDVREDGW
jgi:hypothetical protein